ncbi:Sodium-dependent nutrient amino acid transporter 1 [Eumeta japonica]|uniref:Transporter n=1 Tax=Eumeta variegata TaxID=151549 RepID=A0A4C1Y130_EUMVA|nr:Sodium-dependent nutrient amino acid transporter 1 [Eumeta japonica]
MSPLYLYMNGVDNAGFDSAPELAAPPPGGDPSKAGIPELSRGAFTEPPITSKKPGLDPAFSENGKLPENQFDDNPGERAMWGNQIEFLMSCIATSVGLGNVWRFPFVAYNNGGGAFLIPYIIVLILVGKPMYYLECFIGQFSSRNSVKVWALSPAMKGTGYGQALGCGYVLSYYVSIIALCIFYFAMSFRATLPWAVCDPDWNEPCLPSVGGDSLPSSNDTKSSAELYFVKRVLRQIDGIEGGLGAPNWDLTVCLLMSWLIIFAVVARGVKSSGKAAYFLALFPYVIMIILLIRSATLDGAGDGILFFLTPQWGKLIELQVWYAAVTQVFFSLSVSMGAIIMFSSYNSFSQNVYRDAMIVTTLDTFTSLLSGITIFGVLGNLAKELGRDSIDDVIGSGGTSLAFISYPDAIAKSPFAPQCSILYSGTEPFMYESDLHLTDFFPQLFAVLFFLMMAVLGVGSAVALLSNINTVFLDAFPRVPTIYISAIGCCCGFLSGLVYVTPGGQYILELVDYYGGTFLILFTAITETIGVFWIYVNVVLTKLRLSYHIVRNEIGTNNKTGIGIEITTKTKTMKWELSVKMRSKRRLGRLSKSRVAQLLKFKGHLVGNREQTGIRIENQSGSQSREEPRSGLRARSRMVTATGIDHPSDINIMRIYSRSYKALMIIVTGLENLCLDIAYMLKIKTSFYWRLCWGVITPGIMIAVFIYALITVEALTFGAEEYVYPTLAYALGYVMLFVGIAFVPIFMIIAMYKNRTGNFLKTLKKSFMKKDTWGPRSMAHRREWLAFRRKAKESRQARYASFRSFPWLRNALIVLTVGYQRDD